MAVPLKSTHALALSHLCNHDLESKDYVPTFMMKNPFRDESLKLRTLDQGVLNTLIQNLSFNIENVVEDNKNEK